MPNTYSGLSLPYLCALSKSTVWPVFHISTLKKDHFVTTVPNHKTHHTQLLWTPYHSCTLFTFPYTHKQGTFTHHDQFETESKIIQTDFVRTIWCNRKRLDVLTSRHENDVVTNSNASDILHCRWATHDHWTVFYIELRAFLEK